MNDLSLRGIARKYREIRSCQAFSVKEDIFEGENLQEENSLRDRLSDLARKEFRWTVKCYHRMHRVLRFEQTWTQITIKIKLIPDRHNSESELNALEDQWKAQLENILNNNWNHFYPGELYCPFTFKIQWSEDDSEMVNKWTKQFTENFVGYYLQLYNNGDLKTIWENLIKGIANNISSQATLLPQFEAGKVRPQITDVDTANAEFETRRKEIIELWLTDLRRFGIGDFEDQGDGKCFRRIAAGLTALKEGRNHFRNTPSSNFPQVVEEWTSTIGIEGRAVGSYVKNKQADYDMTMKEMINLLYIFKNDRNLLTDTAVFNIINLGLKPFIGTSLKKLTYKVCSYLQPETENHVLMIFGCKYLLNQFVALAYRPNLRGLRNEYDVNELISSRLEDLLLQAAGRVLHNGLFETNGRPYQVFTFHAILNLYSFAKTILHSTDGGYVSMGESPLKNAAQNALDYLATKYAFQSFEGRRITPCRRSHKDATHLKLYQKDELMGVFGVLSGAARWPNSLNEVTGYEAPGVALWTVLSDYRLPRAIHDYMLNKYNGYWAKMQARYYENEHAHGHWYRWWGVVDETGHYRMHHPPEYFVNGESFSKGILQSNPEHYFVTPHFANCSGSRYNRYVMAYDWVDNESVRNKKGNIFVYDFLSAPQTLLTKGWTNEWHHPIYLKLYPDTLGCLKKDYMHMRGDYKKWFRSTNDGCYKSFSYGYLHRGKDYEIMEEWPIFIPSSFRKYLYKETGQIEFKNTYDSLVKFRFYDLKTIPEKGFYIILGHFRKNTRSKKYLCYARGFWEIVPGDKFSTVSTLKKWVLEHNPDEFVLADPENEVDSSWKYKMTTGETVELDPLVGYDSGGWRNTIKRIWDENDQELPLNEYTCDRLNKDAIEKFPLLEVREIEPNDRNHYKLSDSVIAYASGDGILSVRNPHIGEFLLLDSSDYANPSRNES